MGTKEIKGVEIFSVGTWNGDTFTEAHLDAMADSFNQLKDHIEPALKLGHDDEQKLLQSDGLPAAGWVNNIYRKGEKLFADFHKVPEKIYALLEKGAYRKPSIELYQGLELMGKKFSHFIGAIALLGSDIPGVQNLDDILALYGITNYDDKIKVFTDEAEKAKIYQYETKQSKKGDNMPTLEEQLAESKVTIRGLEDKVKKFEAQIKESDKTNKGLEDLLKETKDTLKEVQSNYKQSADKLKQAEIDKQVAELEGAKLITPAMKPFVKNLLDADKKEYTITKEEKEQSYSRFDLIKETLELAKASDVNFDDNSADGKGKKTDFSSSEMAKEIEKYQAEKECDYSTAARAVMKKYDTKDDLDSLEEVE